jgi:hypothetical protein
MVKVDKGEPRAGHWVSVVACPLISTLVESPLISTFLISFALVFVHFCFRYASFTA